MAIRFGMNRVGVAVAAPTALALALSACSTQTSASSSNGSSTIILGAVENLSGELQSYGKPAADATQAVVDYWNAHGGIKIGDKTYRLAISLADNRSDATVTASASQKVVAAHALVSIGPDGTNATVGYDIFNKANIFMFTASPQLQPLLQADPSKYPLLYTDIPYYSDLDAIELRQILSQQPSIKRIGIIADDTTIGVTNQLANDARALGLDVVAQEIYPYGKVTDFSPFLTKIKAARPDLLIMRYATPDTLTIFKQADQLRVAPYFMNEGMDPDDVVGADLHSKVFVTNYSPTVSRSVMIPTYHPGELFKSAIPASPGAEIVVYSSLQMVLKAAQEASTATDIKAIASKLQHISYNGPFGTCSMQSGAVVCQIPLVIVQGTDVHAILFSSSVHNPQVVARYSCTRGQPCTKE
jgi:ABC-type branched-subunit amino acid transport system substrate-binding protein